MFWQLIFAAAVAAQPRIVDQVDPMDDVRSAFVFLDTRQTYLAAGCLNVADPSSMAVLAKFDRVIDRKVPTIFAGGTLVEYRIDQQPHVTERWTSQRYVVRVKGSPAMKFLLAMRGSRQIYLRAQRFDADVVQLSFTYSDPSRLVDDVLARYGHNPDGSRTAGARRH